MGRADRSRPARARHPSRTLSRSGTRAAVRDRGDRVARSRTRPCGRGSGGRTGPVQAADRSGRPARGRCRGRVWVGVHDHHDLGQGHTGAARHALGRDLQSGHLLTDRRRELSPQLALSGGGPGHAAVTTARVWRRQRGRSADGSRRHESAVPDSGRRGRDQLPVHLRRQLGSADHRDRVPRVGGRDRVADSNVAHRGARDR